VCWPPATAGVDMPGRRLGLAAIAPDGRRLCVPASGRAASASATNRDGATRRGSMEMKAAGRPQSAADRTRRACGTGSKTADASPLLRQRGWRATRDRTTTTMMSRIPRPTRGARIRATIRAGGRPVRSGFVTVAEFYCRAEYLISIFPLVRHCPAAAAAEETRPARKRRWRRMSRASVISARRFIFVSSSLLLFH
jgi:hypothetical protein